MELLDTEVVDIRQDSVALYAAVFDPRTGTHYACGVEVEADDNDGVSYYVRVQHISWKTTATAVDALAVYSFLESDSEVTRLLIDTAKEPTFLGWRKAS